MIGKLLDFKDYLKDVIEDIGGIKVFIIALVITIVAFPFMMLYYLIIEPLYKMIRILTDAPKLGIKKAYMKYFNSEQFDKERWKMEEEEKEALDSRLLPDSRQKRFKDWEDWPNAYVVDKVAVYAADGRTLLYVDERVEEFDVPEGVKNIYHRCFACCDVMKRVSIPSTVKRIGKGLSLIACHLKKLLYPSLLLS